MTSPDKHGGAGGRAYDLQLRFELKSPARFVFENLSDTDKFVAIHPLIQRMERVGPNDYVVYERIKVWIFPFRFTYPATVVSDRSSMKVTMCATVMRLTSVRMEYDIQPKADGCLVCEDITFATWLPVRFILRRLFQTQHRKLFANLDALGSHA